MVDGLFAGDISDWVLMNTNFNAVRVVKHARWMNVPSYVKSKRVAITSLLATARSTQVRGA